LFTTARETVSSETRLVSTNNHLFIAPVHTVCLPFLPRPIRKRPQRSDGRTQD